MAESSPKWLSNVTADTPLSEAAAIALRGRLAYVGTYLPRAAYEYQQDAEHVHQLRVGTRRAAAAMAAFANVLPPKQGKNMRKALRTMRKAAGDARDWDVLLIRLEDSADPLMLIEFAALAKLLKRNRRKAQSPLKRVAKAWPDQRLVMETEALLKRSRWRSSGDEPSFQDVSQRQMRATVKAFAAAANHISPDSSIDSLHQLRIAAKRLRYTIELFACVADPSLRISTYPKVRELQDHLGRLNDHATAAERLRSLAERTKKLAHRDRLQQLSGVDRMATRHAANEFVSWFNQDRCREIVHGVNNVIDRNQSADVLSYPPTSVAG